VQVIFGAGPLALAVARTLLASGGQVRIVSRSGRAELAGAEVLAADATDPKAVRMVCQGASVAYHCAAAPYAQWARLSAPLMDGIVAGASAADARVVYGDNLYCYGPVEGPITEDLPNRPVSEHAKARAVVAESLLAAHDRGEVSAVIGRASDFYGPGVRFSIVGDRVFGAALAGKPAQVLPDPDTAHTFTFIEDFARALVNLGSHDEATGQVWHVPSAEPCTTRGFVEQVYAVAGTKPRLRVAPKFLVHALGLVSPTMKTLTERLYQTERPFVMDHSKYDHAFGVHPTPHGDAIRTTLDWYKTH
jgi:nucleoside-diphosphate-sugar epimerase